MKCKWCGNRITEERRKVYCSNKCYQEARREEHRKHPEEKVKHPTVLKNKEVCKGCKYLLSSNAEPKSVCNYLEATGHSRIMVERANGGVKADSCCCYDAGSRERKSKGAY